MRNLLPFLLVMLAVTGIFAKQSPGGETIDPFVNKTAAAYYPEENLPLPLSGKSVTAYVQALVPHLAQNGVALVLKTHKTSPGGEHFTFEQSYNGLPVYNSQTKVNLGTTGKVYSIFDNSYNTANWSSATLIADADAINSVSLAQYLINFTGYSEAEIQEHAVIVVIDNKPAAYKLLQLYHAETGDHKLYLLAKDGTVAYQHDLNSYSGVPAQAYVFNPDPITSAQTVYGAPYVDSADANTAVLRNERVLVTVDAKLSGGIYLLENDYFVITNFSAPNQTVVSSSTPSFLFTRADTAFEEVNAYYHLNTYRNYIASLGFTALTTEQIQVDAHALNGNDNSQFSAGGGFPRLFFGDGGVDDAEDADVVVHEYGHALSFFGSPSTNFGQQRQALDEGFGDYFAASYSRSISTYKWSDVFSWDGHNTIWSGRNAATTKIYPEDLDNSIHRNGEMWATALMEVWSALGQDKADRLALQTLFSLASNMSFTDAANAYLQADDALYGGANYNVIYTIMENRGFFNTIGVETVNNGVPAFQLMNSWGFTNGNGPTIVQNFTSQPMSITIFDISGKAIKHLPNLTGPTHYLNGEQLVSGLYIIKVAAGDAVQTFRLVK